MEAPSKIPHSWKLQGKLEWNMFGLQGYWSVFLFGLIILFVHNVIHNLAYAVYDAAPPLSDLGFQTFPFLENHVFFVLGDIAVWIVLGMGLVLTVLPFFSQRWSGFTQLQNQFSEFAVQAPLFEVVPLEALANIDQPQPHDHLQLESQPVSSPSAQHEATNSLNDHSASCAASSSASSSPSFDSSFHVVDLAPLSACLGKEEQSQPPDGVNQQSDNLSEAKESEPSPFRFRMASTEYGDELGAEPVHMMPGLPTLSTTVTVRSVSALGLVVSTSSDLAATIPVPNQARVMTNDIQGSTDQTVSTSASVSAAAIASDLSSSSSSTPDWAIIDMEPASDQIPSSCLNSPSTAVAIEPPSAVGVPVCAAIEPGLEQPDLLQPAAGPEPDIGPGHPAAAADAVVRPRPRRRCRIPLVSNIKLFNFWRAAPPRFCVLMLARAFMVLSLAQVARMISFISTELPSPAEHCQPGSPDLNPPDTGLEIAFRLDTATGCGDLIFSSHATFCIVASLAVMHYFRSIILTTIMLVLSTIMSLLLVATHRHYSVDLLVAWYVVPLIWLALVYVWPDPTPQELSDWLTPVAARHQLQLDRRRLRRLQGDPQQLLDEGRDARDQVLAPSDSLVAVSATSSSTASQRMMLASLPLPEFKSSRITF